MSLQKLILEIEETIPNILEEKGSIVYSSVNSICKGNLYIMGLNPGGKDGKTIKQTLDELPNKSNNSYEDDDKWGNIKQFEPGQHPLQKNYKCLKKSLNADKEIFSTNLIFTQSTDQGGANYPTNAEYCWNVHKKFINIIDPKCLIVFGIGSVSPYNFIKHNYTLEVDPNPQKSGHGNWPIYCAETAIENKKRLIIGVPHLSIYSISTKPEVIEWIKNRIHGFKN
ncbi:MAG TPA: hypothetical protein VNW51_06205 [Mucilaginibacter sp.]|jgi:hypothetical protein|nr:hypothetical protein [Mucilaginibacter sp.]